MPRRTVILTGYWPVTNQMLTEFSRDRILNPDGWQGSNWQGLGYDIIAFFAAYPASPFDNPKGTGDFEVDYQKTLADFRRITRQYKPITIICYGMGQGPWEIEQNAVVRDYWSNDYRPPQQPDIALAGLTPKSTLHATLPVDAIAEAVNTAGLNVAAWVDKNGDPGDFLCNFMACLAMDYQQKHSDKSQPDYCAAAGFIHVGPEVTLEQAHQAQIRTLETTLHYIRHK